MLPEEVGTPVTVTLSSSENPANSGDTITFDVSVTGNPASYGVATGTVSLFTGVGLLQENLGTATLDSNGNASIELSDLPVGTEEITAYYTPAGDYLPGGSTPLQQVVN